MKIEPGDKHVLDEDFHDLVGDDILELYINQNNPDMVGSRQGAGQQGPQRIVVCYPMRNLPKLSGENWINRQSSWCIWWLSENTKLML